jgi:coproporphyrinogen III oxidase-like Fe-S oxidoreductase
MLDTQTVALEMILMQLRLNEGLSLASFRARIGVDPRALFDGVLDRLADRGWLIVTDQAIVLTRQGRLAANAVMAELAAKV